MTVDPPDLEQSFLMLREAVASVSMSHRNGCDCVVCKAAAGDEDALLQVLNTIRDP